MNKLSLLTVALLTLSGCSSVTPYRPYEAQLQTGYYSSKKSDGSFGVVFKGHESTKPTQAYDFTLLRSAEVAKENGAAYFVIIGEYNWRTEGRTANTDNTANNPTTIETTAPTYGNMPRLPNSDQDRLYQDQIRAHRPKDEGVSPLAGTPGVPDSTSSPGSLPPFQANIPPSPSPGGVAIPNANISPTGPEYCFLINIYPDRPQTASKVYTADEVITELRAKYKLRK